MSKLQNLKDSLAEDEVDSIETGETGYDLVIKDAPLQNGQTVDLLLYMDSNYTVEMIGLSENSFDQKREETSEWVDYFMSKGFSNIHRRLKNPDYISDSLIGEGMDEDYYFSSNLDEEQRRTVREATSDFLDWEKIDESYEMMNQRI